MKAKEMTEAQATSYYNRLYNTALKSVDRSVRTNVNVARELYASTLAPYAEEYRKKGYNIFELDNAKNKVELNTLFEKTRNLAFEKTALQMDAFYEKFKDSPNLRKIFNDYRDGKMTRHDFNQSIKEWKQLSIKYMISGSK